MSNYQYTNPLDKGYTRFKLTKKQHNEIFKNRKMKWQDKYEYYYNDNTILIHKFYDWKVVLLTTLLFPIYVLLQGIFNIKEMCEELISLYNQKEKGSFVSDYIYKTEKRYNQIMNIINKNN